MSRHLSPWLRPYICKDCRSRALALTPPTKRFKTNQSTDKPDKSPKPQLEIRRVGSKSEAIKLEERINFHGGQEAVRKLFPRWNSRPRPLYSAADFAPAFAAAKDGDSINREAITVYGRLTGRRSMGNKLLFIELSTSDEKNERIATQIQINLMRLSEPDSSDQNAVSRFSKRIWRGDWIAATGRPSIDNNGMLRLDAIRIPRIIAPSLQNIPEELTDQEFRVRNKHVEHIVDPSSRDILYLRSAIMASLREYFRKEEFLEVNTPLLVAGAGGATARPFETVSTEFSDTKLSLRVAPELFLKRIILGGVPKVFEIGPAFRNEGVDATHNPEFTICEFYAVMKSLDDLMHMTENIFSKIAKHVSALGKTPALPFDFDKHFERIEFIPTLEKCIRDDVSSDWTFPDLEDREAATASLIRIMREAKVSVPVPATLPRLLDALAGKFLEPLCQQPTFITHHPECMSPLAKSFLREPIDPSDTIRHRVSARAELFILGREYVNCYEEENSPLDQQRKFEVQLALRAAGDDEAQGVVDENYLQALTWGMPPTGGWGCGIDRIVMLFGGKERIADVLPFGNLRNVVGLGRQAVLAHSQAQPRSQATVSAKQPKAARQAPEEDRARKQAQAQPHGVDNESSATQLGITQEQGAEQTGATHPSPRPDPQSKPNLDKQGHQDQNPSSSYNVNNARGSNHSPPATPPSAPIDPKAKPTKDPLNARKWPLAGTERRPTAPVNPPPIDKPSQEWKRLVNEAGQVMSTDDTKPDGAAKTPSPREEQVPMHRQGQIQSQNPRKSQREEQMTKQPLREKGFVAPKLMSFRDLMGVPSAAGSTSTLSEARPAQADRQQQSEPQDKGPGSKIP